MQKHIKSTHPYLGIILMVLVAFLVAVGQLFWKLSAGANGFDWLWFILGTGLYGGATLLMMGAFRFGRLSVLQPMLALSFAFMPILGCCVLGESISMPQYLGIAIVAVGVILVGVGDD